MYEGYADLHRWKLELLDRQLSDMGGFRDITFVVKGDDAWSRLKHEAGRAPRAARARHREPGPRAHERGVGRGAARSRGSRRRRQRERSRRSTSTGRAAPVVSR